MEHQQKEGITDEELTDSAPVVNMDDTTGSDGGPATSRSSEDDDYSHDSQRDKKHLSRSDTSRAGETSVSGGTGDADTSQSGGRSQY